MITCMKSCLSFNLGHYRAGVTSLTCGSSRPSWPNEASVICRNSLVSGGLCPSPSDRETATLMPSNAALSSRSEALQINHVAIHITSSLGCRAQCSRLASANRRPTQLSARRTRSRSRYCAEARPAAVSTHTISKQQQTQESITCAAGQISINTCRGTRPRAACTPSAERPAAVLQG